MIKLLDYKLWLIIGLSLIIIYLYKELRNTKSKLLELQNKENDQKEIENNIICDELVENGIPKDLTNELVNFDFSLLEHQETSINLPDMNINQTIVEEINEQKIETKPIENNIEATTEMTETEIPIYSNDNDSSELLSLNITDKIETVEKQILDENDENNELKDTCEDKEDKSEHDNELDEILSEDKSEKDKKLDEILSEGVKENNNVIDDSESEKTDIKEMDLVKMKKSDLMDLAKKYNLSLVVDNNGKIKKKTKGQIIDDLLKL